MNNEDFLNAMEGLFTVHDSEESVELETWTRGGVNMFISLRKDDKSYFEQFKEYVENFDMDEEIDFHREDQRYKNAFSITMSVQDFTAYEEWLESIVERLDD